MSGIFAKGASRSAQLQGKRQLFILANHMHLQLVWKSAFFNIILGVSMFRLNKRNESLRGYSVPEDF